MNLFDENQRESLKKKQNKKFWLRKLNFIFEFDNEWKILKSQSDHFTPENHFAKIFNTNPWLIQEWILIFVSPVVSLLKNLSREKWCLSSFFAPWLSKSMKKKGKKEKKDL